MKRVLLISYYFPPSGGPGVQRSLKFVKYLAEFGWMPTVLTVDPRRAAYPDLDDTLEAEIPADVDVVRTYSWDPYAGYARFIGRSKQDAIGVSFVSDSKGGARERIARWIRANVFVPDARIGWTAFANLEARKLLDNTEFDAILSTGPPHSSHLVGRSVARRTGLPWLVDLRDPWTGVFYYSELPMSGLARNLDRRLETSVLSQADVVTVVSRSMGTALAERVDRPYEYIPNGYDEQDFSGLTAARDDGPGVIRHVGNIGPSQNPTALWRALANGSGHSSLSRLQVEFVGNVDAEVIAEAQRHGLKDRIRVRDYVPHDEAVRLMIESSVLLLVIPDVPNAAEIVTGKLFEYLASGRPVLGIGPPGGDADQILGEVGGGRMFERDDVRGVAAFVASQSQGGEHMHFPRTGDERVSRYERRRLTARLAGLLDNMTRNAG